MLWREQRTPYGPLSVCHIFPNNLATWCRVIVRTHCYATVGTEAIVEICSCSNGTQGYFWLTTTTSDDITTGTFDAIVVFVVQFE
jgi:hypothetical protein